jgi:hypothetical protein
MNDSTMIKSQLKSLEAQLRVMEAFVGRLPEEQASERNGFGDLFGSLSDQAESSEEEIDAILNKVPAAQENEI